MTAVGLVAFDLDGTLIDSRRDLASAANDLLARRGRPPLPVADVAGMVGEGARVLMERVFAASGLPAPGDHDLDEFARRYHEHLVDTTRPYDGADDTLRRVAALCRLAIVTNKPRAHTARLVEHFGWAPLVATIVGGDAPFPRKPSPEGLRHAMAQAGVAAAATVMVGDSQVDLATARAAGVRFAHARYGFGATGVPAGALAGEDWVLEAPQDLLRRLAG
jgi:phosphoglycolate phosphatase